MEITGISVESDTSWMKMADLLVTTGVISEWIEQRSECSTSSGASVPTGGLHHEK